MKGGYLSREPLYIDKHPHICKDINAHTHFSNTWSYHGRQAKRYPHGGGGNRRARHSEEQV